MVLIQGKNEFVQFYINRTMEFVGLGATGVTTFTVRNRPIADRNLDGVVNISDVSVFVGANRGVAVPVAVASIVRGTGAITLSAAPAVGARVYVTYMWETTNITYAQEYSITSDLETKTITPLSAPIEEIIDIVWKYEGSIKVWDAHDIEEDLVMNIDQTEDTIIGGILTRSSDVPANIHHLVIRKVRGPTSRFRVLRDIRINNVEEGSSGGELSEKTLKFVAGNLVRGYVPV